MRVVSRTISGRLADRSNGKRLFQQPTKQPELKHSAASVDRADWPWSLLAIAWLPDHSALRTCAAMRSHMAQFGFASCVPFGRERTGVVFRAVAERSPGEDTVQALVRLLALDAPGVLHNADAARGQRRAVQLTVQLTAQGDNRSLQALPMAGDAASGSWMQTVLQQSQPAQGLGPLLLHPGTEPPARCSLRGGRSASASM